MMSRLFEDLLKAAVGAIVATIASAIIDRLLPARINISYWWAWAIGGFLVTLLIVWVYRRCSPGVLTYGSKATIRTSDDNYVKTDVYQNNQLFGRADTQKWTIFEIVKADMPFMRTPNKPVHYNDKIAFRSLNNNLFVGADLANEKQLRTWNSEVGWWETFTLCPPESTSSGQGQAIRYGSFFALRAFNENYVKCILNGDGRLLADANYIGTETTFVLVDPKRPK